MARLTQAIATYFGGSTSVGVGTVSGLDADNGDNGLYVIGGDWEIVARKYYIWPEEADPAKTSEIADKIVAALADNAKD